MPLSVFCNVQGLNFYIGIFPIPRSFYVYSDTAILIFLPSFVVKLVAPAAEEDICYGNDSQKYRAQYGQRISEHFFCGIGIVILAVHINFLCFESADHSAFCAEAPPFISAISL